MLDWVREVEDSWPAIYVVNSNLCHVCRLQGRQNSLGVFYTQVTRTSRLRLIVGVEYDLKVSLRRMTLCIYILLCLISLGTMAPTFVWSM